MAGFNHSSFFLDLDVSGPPLDLISEGVGAARARERKAKAKARMEERCMLMLVDGEGVYLERICMDSFGLRFDDSLGDG